MTLFRQAVCFISQIFRKMPVEEVRPVLKFTRVSEHAFPPVKGSEKAAGFDLRR